MIRSFPSLLTAALLAAVAPAAAAQHSHAPDSARTARDTASAPRSTDAASHDSSRHRAGNHPHGPSAMSMSTGAHRESHGMWMQPLGGGWTLAGMAQAIPTLTGSEPRGPESAPHSWEPYLTQPAAMLDLLSPRSRFAL